MREGKLRYKKTDELYIYFEHDADMPDVVEDVAEEIVVLDLSSSSSSTDDGYETTEDEPYKPPPGFETDDNGSEEENKSKKKFPKKGVSAKKMSNETAEYETEDKSTDEDKRTKKKNSVPKKTVSPKKNEGKNDGLSSNTPRQSPITAKKRTSKKYSGSRRRHILRDGLGKKGMEGQSNGPRPSVGAGQTEQRDGPVGGSGEGPSMGDGPSNRSSVPTEVEMDSDYEKPYEYESEAFKSPVSSEDERRTSYDSFSEDIEYGEVVFNVGQIFPTMDLFKKALKDYFVFEGKNVLYIKNEKHRLTAACAAEDCPWLIFTSWNSASRCFQVKTLIDEHTCARDYGSNMTDRGLVASKFIKRLFIHPDMKPRQAMDYMIEEYNMQLNYRMIARALKVAREVVIGNARAQYEKVRDYLSEIHRSNPGSTTLMETIPQPEALPLFDRFYISLDASKKGFIQGCRLLIGLDGYFLKGYFLAEIEGLEQKSDSEVEKGLLMLLDSDLPALKVDFLELQNSKWRVSNCVGK
ncbi:hypothetical protein AHAS_Ahas11G0160600 [Arachis hypogaea]